MRKSLIKAMLLPFCILPASSPLYAQAMDHSMHGGMAVPSAGDAHGSHQTPPAAPAEKYAPVQNGQHAGHGAAATRPTAAGTDLPAGNAPAPQPAADHLADAIWGAKAMADPRERLLRKEHGGMTFRQILFNLAELRLRNGRDGYRWNGEAWIGGDIDRLAIKSEGDGEFSGGLERGEVQALYSRAVDPYWNLQAGIRQDFGPGPARTYAVIGVEGLAPYWFDVETSLFLSQKGEILGRVEAWYDQRLTQFVVLQPRAEANLAAQKIPEDGRGSGVTDFGMGLRVRYERSREFAPYLGITWERHVGSTARLARGGEVGGAGLIAGVRAWF